MHVKVNPSKPSVSRNGAAAGRFGRRYSVIDSHTAGPPASSHSNQDCPFPSIPSPTNRIPSLTRATVNSPIPYWLLSCVSVFSSPYPPPALAVHVASCRKCDPTCRRRLRSSLHSSAAHAHHRQSVLQSCALIARLQYIAKVTIAMTLGLSRPRKLLPASPSLMRWRIVRTRS